MRADAPEPLIDLPPLRDPRLAAVFARIPPRAGMSAPSDLDTQASAVVRFLLSTRFHNYGDVFQ